MPASPVTDGSNTPSAHGSASAPLPPPGTPLKDIYEELAARARSGDRAASVRLFHDTAKCRFVDDFHQALPLIMPMMMAITKPGNSDAANKRLADTLDLFQRKVDWARKTEPLCEGADQESSRSSPDWMRIAAQQGDLEAIDCYLDLNFGDIRDAMQHLHWLDDFRRVGPNMAVEAAANGDWKAVYQLANAYDGGNGMQWLAQSIRPNPLQAYRYTSLLDMVWPGHDNVQDRLQTLADQLSTSEMAAAKAWAQDVFANSFHSRPTNPDEFKNLCRGPMAW